MRLLSNATALSEFQGFTGDCGEDAELAALHILNGLADDAANLNAITRQEIADKEASATGSEPINAIAQDLTERKVNHTVWGYAEPFNHDWQGCLKSDAGVNPIILELANAQALHGDEAGVHYHFICVVGIDDQGNYICSDGDNVAARTGQLVRYSEAQLAAAVPCALVEVVMPAQPKPSYPAPSIMGFFSPMPNGWMLTAPGPHQGVQIIYGMLKAYQNWPAAGTGHGLTALGLPLANEAPVPGHPGCAWQPFERGVLVFDPHRSIDNPPGAQGDVYVAHADFRV